MISQSRSSSGARSSSSRLGDRPPVQIRRRRQRAHQRRPGRSLAQRAQHRQPEPLRIPLIPSHRHPGGAPGQPRPPDPGPQQHRFTVGSGGRLNAAPGSPFPAQGLGPFGSEFRPANPDQLFVSNAHNTATDSGTVSAFKDHRNGRLSSIAGSPFPDHQMAPCWVEITQDGQFLFTVNTASGTISGYRIAANGGLILLPGSTPAGGPNVGAVDARLSPDGGFLYVDQSKAHAVAAFAVSGGSLTQLHASPFPLPAGAAPAGIVVS
jgi:DNA-binding beta-propeller fold protein YncE